MIETAVHGSTLPPDWKACLPWPDRDKLRSAAELISGSDDVVDALSVLSPRLGFDYFSLVTRCPNLPRQSQQQTVVRSSYPDSWKEIYQHRQYVCVDPVINLARTARVPFFWGRKHDLSGTTASGQQVMHEAREFNICFGLSVPIYGPMGDITLLSMSTRHGPGTFEDLVRDSYNLLWMISPVIYAATSTSHTTFSAPDDVKLTDQERICLLWTLRGKTSWEISQIISRSKPTVEYHLQKSMRKFGVTTKIQAAVQAMKAGILEP
jgi:DNA-binding CsgD family transcriptional regulator